jgi:hypothetical protein
MSKWFYDTFIGAATGAVCCGFLVGKSFLVSWSLAMDEHGEQQDLHSSSR